MTLCGVGSFPQVDEDPWSSPPTPRVPRRRHGGSNPYSTRGLDKFSMVLADLESRRERIMEKAGAQGVSVVRFAYSSSHDWVPVVVRPREQRPEPAEEPKKGAAAEIRKNPVAAAGEHPAPPRTAERTHVNDGAAPAEAAPTRVAKKSFCGKVGGGEGGGFFRWDPSYYWPAVAVLILLSLAIGRAFAICLISIWWFSVPRVTVDERRSVRKATKKGYRRRKSEKKLRAAASGDVAMAAPAARAKGGNLVGLASPYRQHQTSPGKKGPR